MEPKQNKMNKHGWQEIRKFLPQSFGSWVVFFQLGAKSLNSFFSKAALKFQEFLTTLQGTNTSPQNGILKMIFLFPRWNMLIPWRVTFTIVVCFFLMFLEIGYYFFRNTSNLIAFQRKKPKVRSSQMQWLVQVAVVHSWTFPSTRRFQTEKNHGCWFQIVFVFDVHLHL